MAKKSAFNRITVSEMSYENNAPTRRDESGNVVPSDLIGWEKTTVALMSDKTILIKRDTRFLDRAQKDYGTWKVYGKLKDGLTKEDFIRIYEKRGYTRKI